MPRHASVARMMAALTLPMAALVAGSAAAQSYGNMERYRWDFAQPNNDPPTGGAVKVTFFGTTALLFDDGTRRFLVDGFFSRPSSLPVLLNLPLRVDKDAIDKVLRHHRLKHLDAVLVSHSHYDHALDAAYIASTTGARLFGSTSTCNIASGAGFPEASRECFPTDKRSDIDLDTFKITVLPSRHSPATLLNDDLGALIETPLRQPAIRSAYREGHSVDFLIQHQGRTILVKPSANYVPDLQPIIRADVLFLGTGRLGNQTTEFMNEFYQHTVVRFDPTLVVPIHWDDLTEPLSTRLSMSSRFVNDVPRAFDFLKAQLPQKTKFRIMQGCQSILLFKNGEADIHEDPGSGSVPDTCHD